MRQVVAHASRLVTSLRKSIFFLILLMVILGVIYWKYVVGITEGLDNDMIKFGLVNPITIDFATLTPQENPLHLKGMLLNGIQFVSDKINGKLFVPNDSIATLENSQFTQGQFVINLDNDATSYNLQYNISPKTNAVTITIDDAFLDILVPQECPKCPTCPVFDCSKCDLSCPVYPPITPCEECPICPTHTNEHANDPRYQYKVENNPTTGGYEFVPVT